jgi:hypothetical protein
MTAFDFPDVPVNMDLLHSVFSERAPNNIETRASVVFDTMHADEDKEEGVVLAKSSPGSPSDTNWALVWAVIAITVIVLLVAYYMYRGNTRRQSK